MKPLCVIFLCAALHAKTPIWIDSDPSMAPGGHEIDDGFAWIQAFHSRELAVRGVSIVFGNAPLDRAMAIAREFLPLVAPGFQPFAGASAAAELGVETAATRAMAQTLRKERLTILALGPLTNVATLLRNHPELAPRIVAIVAVAGRRPGQHFTTGTKSTTPFRDFNFELDPQAFQVLLDSKAPIVLVPWEISSKVWLRSEDVARFATGGNALRWLIEPAQGWLQFWKQTFGVDGFNPFDTLAIAYVTSPQLLRCEDLPVAIRELPDDVQQGRSKPYLLAAPELAGSRIARYCHEAKPEFHDQLMKSLLAAP